MKGDQTSRDLSYMSTHVMTGTPLETQVLENADQLTEGKGHSHGNRRTILGFAPGEATNLS